MANHWLLKTEPSAYSFDDLERDKRTTWDGVANPLALKHLRAMQRGDQVFIYHTGAEKQIVGIAQVVSNSGPVPELKPVRRLGRPVRLAEIKLSGKFAGFELVQMPRLSVMPVSADRWQKLVALADG